MRYKLKLMYSAHAQPQQSSDIQLIGRAISNDNKACYELVKRYKNAVYNHLCKMSFSHEDAEDLTQETFMKAFSKLKSYEPHYAFSTWLFRIAINNGIDFVRRKKLPCTSLDSGAEYTMHDRIGYSTESPEDQMVRFQNNDAVRVCIRQLKYEYQLMIELRYFEEKSYEAIALELEVPIGTVKAQLHRAKNALYKLLADRMIATASSCTC